MDDCVFSIKDYNNIIVDDDIFPVEICWRKRKNTELLQINDFKNINKNIYIDVNYSEEYLIYMIYINF